jgi:hypothetical protein
VFLNVGKPRASKSAGLSVPLLTARQPSTNFSNDTYPYPLCPLKFPSSSGALG